MQLMPHVLSFAEILRSLLIPMKCTCKSHLAQYTFIFHGNDLLLYTLNVISSICVLSVSGIRLLKRDIVFAASLYLQSTCTQKLYYCIVFASIYERYTGALTCAVMIQQYLTVIHSPVNVQCWPYKAIVNLHSSYQSNMI